MLLSFRGSGALHIRTRREVESSTPCGEPTNLGILSDQPVGVLPPTANSLLDVSGSLSATSYRLGRPSSAIAKVDSRSRDHQKAGQPVPGGWRPCAASQLSTPRKPAKPVHGLDELKHLARSRGSNWQALGIPHVFDPLGVTINFSDIESPSECPPAGGRRGGGMGVAGIPMSFIAGLYGMSFKGMPELS